MRGYNLGFGQAAFRFVLGAAVLSLWAGTAAPALSQSQSQTGNAPEAQAFTPPPRSIADITAILDSEKPDPAKVAAAQQSAAAQPPAGASDADLQKFYSARAQAADNLGRQQQAIADYTKAVELAARNQDAPTTMYGEDGVEAYALALQNLSRVNRKAGNIQTALQLSAQVVDLFQKGAWRRGLMFGIYESNAADAARSGDFAAADNWLQQIDLLKQQSSSVYSPGWKLAQNKQSNFAATTDRAHGEVAMYKGDLAAAEPLLRNAVSESRQAELDAAGETYPPPGTNTVKADYTDEQLANVLSGEGRPLQAEFEARRALLSELQLHGRYSNDTVAAITTLGSVLAEEGRFKEAETLARTALDTYQTLGVDQSSSMLNQARGVLASILVAQNRWPDALAQYDAIRKNLAGNPDALKNALGQTLDLPVADLRGGRTQDALQVSRNTFQTLLKSLGD
ncbi:MAG: tetratricopeptide repeat protein, partial [Stellaceae bacterium]